MYPLKFYPILKPTIWGVGAICQYKNMEPTKGGIGESWEISQVNNSISEVSNGELRHTTISSLMSEWGAQLVGKKVYEKFGNKFPLLIKFIDACDDLSIQVHPDDELAKERHHSFGKTEMWYVVDADPGAELIIGFTKDCSHDEYLDALEEGKVENLLQKVPVKKGDVFFIPAGTVHAIGKGVVVAEIQQSSDITYRIYDYKRTDDQGNERELHTEQALDVISFEASKEPKTAYTPLLNDVTPLVKCNYFTTNMLRFNQNITRHYAKIDTFVAYMCLEGNFVIEFGGEKTNVNKGDTILIPASIDELGLIPDSEVTLLEVYVENA